MSEIKATTDARVISWGDLKSDSPMPLVERKRVNGSRMTVARIVLKKGFKLDPHAHDEEQIALIVDGKIRFQLGEPGARKEVTVGGGEILLLPPNVPHGAEALEDTIIFDLFSPPATETGIDRADG
jgi:quercetin dioxygenase-like cupin family protein